MFYKSISCRIMYSKFIFIAVARKLDPTKCSSIRQITCPRALLEFLCKCVLRALAYMNKYFIYYYISVRVHNILYYKRVVQ